MDIFQYYTKNDTGAEALELESVTWEMTHYSPFSHYYSLHVQLEGGANDTSHNGSSPSDYHSAYDQVKFYIECVAISAVGVPGTVGNILSAIVLLTAKMRSPITYLLLGLTLTDILMIVNCLMGMAVPSYFLYFKIDLFRYKFAAFLPVIFSIGKTAHVASVLYALFITMERYFAVMYPLKSRLFCTLTRAKITSILILIFSIIYNIPRFFEYTYIKIPVYPKPFEDDEDGPDEEYYYFPLTGSLRRNGIYRQVISALHFSLFYIIPMVLIIYLNVLIYRKLKCARKMRGTMTVSQITENNVTTMLVLIVGIFVVCNFLPFVNLTSRILTGSPEIFVVDSIRNFLWIFNSSVNFFIYYAYSDGFRETCVELWPTCFKNVCYSSSQKKRLIKSNSSGYNYAYSNSSSRMSVATIASTLGSVKRQFDAPSFAEVHSQHVAPSPNYC